MMIYENIPLKSYNTFGLDYFADFMAVINNEEEAVELFKEKAAGNKPLLILGGGSNILFISDFKGTILYPDFMGRNIETSDEGGNIIVSAGSGENWDDFVEWAVSNGFGGLENLSLIPGKVGATPIQNIGAYGVEIRDMIVKVRTISTLDGTVRIFSNIECEFDYRNSIFKNSEKGKYLVTKVWYKLSTRPGFNLSYGSLSDEVNKLGKVNLKNIRQAVINIRRSKLPDPLITGNAGSFFKNPVVPDSVAENLRKEFTGMPFYSDKPGFTKLASGWLIDKCGWKGKRKGDAGVHDNQALVLINHGKATGKEIFELSADIQKSVLDKFGIGLEREVEIVGSI
jgi:UDP-N-acetylmuramate dehydrogenase